MKDIKIGHSELQGIRNWLRLRYDQYRWSRCPFASHHCSTYSKICAAMFPEVDLGIRYNQPSNHCPCHTVDIEIVKERARELLRVNRGKK